jgi:hypothetical protein
MAETSDFTSLVEVIKSNFHSSHGGHFLEIVEKFFTISFSFSWDLFSFKEESISRELNYA